MNYKHLVLLISIVFFFNSCESDDSAIPLTQEPQGEFESGFFVLNEGNFGSGNASVSFIGSEMEQMQNNIFSTVNGNDLGDTAQSIELFEDLAMIVVNVSNKIEIVNRYTFESLATIDANLQNPRYAEVFGDNIYVTNWGDGTNPDDDFITVFNLSDFSFVTSIPVAEGPEKLLATNNKVFVAHKGGFSFNDIVSVINTANKQVETEVQVGDLPNSMVLEGNNLWVLSGGKPSYAETETTGKLTSINITNNEVNEEFDFQESSVHPANLNIIGNEFYLTIGKTLFKYSLVSMQPTEEFSFEEAAVLYGLEIHDGNVYVASPNADFTGDGTVYVYELATGNLNNQLSVGINPNGVYFN